MLKIKFGDAAIIRAKKAWAENTNRSYMEFFVAAFEQEANKQLWCHVNTMISLSQKEIAAKLMRTVESGHGHNWEDAARWVKQVFGALADAPAQPQDTAPINAALVEAVWEARAKKAEGRLATLAACLNSMLNSEIPSSSPHSFALVVAARTGFDIVTVSKHHLKEKS